MLKHFTAKFVLFATRNGKNTIEIDNLRLSLAKSTPLIRIVLLNRY